MRGYASLGEGTAMGYEAAGSPNFTGRMVGPDEVRAKQAWVAEQEQKELQARAWAIHDRQSGATEVDRRSEVERVLDEQSAAIDRLSSAVTELRSRLAPVLRDEPPQTDPSGPRAMPSVMVAQGIAVRTDEIDRLANMVGSMICRLGV